MSERLELNTLHTEQFSLTLYRNQTVGKVKIQEVANIFFILKEMDQIAIAHSRAFPAPE